MFFSSKMLVVAIEYVSSPG
jgi:hypothetical protein